MKESKWGKKKSIKTAFYFYIAVMLAAVLLLSGTAVKICVMMREEILASHAFIYDPQSGQAGGEEQDFSHAFIFDPRSGQADGEKQDFYGDGYTIPPNGSGEQNGESLPEFTQRDRWICHLLEILTVVLPFFFLCLGIWTAGFVFYAKKLKKPFQLLKQGMEHIEQGDLDFSLEYGRKRAQDELESLCRAFETMRQSVLKNNVEMWNMAEERKRLNASVAHDLRTPITVIKGYSEYLIRNLKKDVISKETMEEILIFIQNAAERLGAYAESVHHIQLLENMELEYHEADLSTLSAEITSMLEVIAEKYDKRIRVSADWPKETVLVSSVAIFRMVENIVQNACDYSREEILVDLAWRENILEITVTDDGGGFPEKIMHRAFTPCYQEEGRQGHYGMGLAICKILARKHGGDIILSNGEDQGAKVFVTLKIGLS